MTGAKTLVTRCKNSITVCSCGALGRMLPSQSGQWLPQPAPEPVARTYAPQTITATLYASVSQAKRASGCMRLAEAIGG
jgi:hypothetical protein